MSSSANASTTCASHIAKKRKKGKGRGSGDGRLPKPSYLDRLPVELLATILSYARSPKDVLAVARCNKHLCAILVNPANVWIWRNARKECISGPLPDPPPWMSEPAFAAFVFDGGPCEICKKWTKKMYASFALRLRLCGNSSCSTNLTKSGTLMHGTFNKAEEHIQKWLPQLENNDLSPMSSLRLGKYRAAAWLSAIDEYNKVIRIGEDLAEYRKRHHEEQRRLEPLMMLCRRLVAWRKNWEILYATVKVENGNFGKARASAAGWTPKDLMDTPSFGSLFRACCNSLEPLSMRDWDAIESQVQLEVRDIYIHRERRSKEQGSQKRRQDIGHYYQRLLSNPDELVKHDVVIPSLTEFRRLPVMVLLRDKETSASEGLRTELKQPAIMDLLWSDLMKWTATAKGELAKVLGFPNWSNTSRKVVHPVHRLTARFICTRCNGVSQKYANEGSLDFVGACRHECVGLSKKDQRKKSSAWSPDQFVPDQKAIDVFSQALMLSKTDAEDDITEHRLGLLGPAFVCKTCPSPIMMDYTRLAGHSKRHESMQLALLFPEQMNPLTYGYNRGSFAEWTSSVPKAKEVRASKTFLCRHCSNHGKAAHAPADDADLTCAADHTSSTSASSTKINLMSLDGMISHVKSKHEIVRMGDEDFYRDPTAATHAEHAEAAT